MQPLIDFFGADGLIPHGYCLSWSPGLLWLHVVSDALIVLAYYSIPLTLAYFVRKRKDLPYPWLFVMFGLFIVACGTTHLLSVITVWIPLYWLDGIAKAVTAAVSVAAALMMFWVVPRALALRSPSQLEVEVQERKQAQAALQEALDRLNKIASQVPGVVFQFRLRRDGSSCVPYASEGIREIYRVAPEEVREDASKVFAHLHPDDLDNHMASIQISAQNLSPWIQEYRLKFEGEPDRWFAGQAIPQKEADGSVLWHGFITDITGRKQAETKTRKSLSLLNATLESTNDAILVVDLHGAWVLYNRQFVDLWRITDDLVASMDDNAALSYVLNQLEDADGFLNKVRELYSTPEASSFDTFKFKSGQTIERYSIPQRIDGEVVGRVWSFRDITERIRTEEALRLKTEETETFFRTALDLLCIANTDGYFLRLNPEWEKTLGYTLDDLQGKRFLDFVHPEDREATLQAMSKLSDQKTILNFTNRYCRKDGTYRWIEWRSRPMGKLVYAAARDITKRKEYEEELLRSNAELEQFSYAVSHDMRQPLRTISSYLQLLEINLADQLDGEKRDYFDSAIEGAKRIDHMLVALLEYSRIGRMGEPPTWIDSRAILDEALQFLQPAITEARARLNITGDWPRIFASRDEILRLLQNLIGNAAKFRVAGRTPEITLTSEIIKNEWRFCIADNGVGIIPDQIKRLFQVFQRLQSREAYEGTGIGLALCRKIAEHHKGRIWAESAGEGAGSKFCVALPVIWGNTLPAAQKE